MTDSLNTTIAKLFITDETFIKDSNGYQTHSNWFVKVYSYLQWQQEVVNMLLHNLVCLDTQSIDKKENLKSNKMKKHRHTVLLHKVVMVVMMRSMKKENCYLNLNY